MDTLQVQRDAEWFGLTTITLNRPEKLNAISRQMHDELQAVCADLQKDAETRVVIFTGAGRAFSAGADRAERRTVDSDPLRMRLQSGTGNRTCAAIERLDQVTIGAVNGLAVGGAVVFLSCMDLRIAAEDAWFSIPEIDLNIPLTWNALPRLMRELGPARTKELVMTGERFSAQQAERWGFVNHIVPAATAVSAARTLAVKLLKKDPLSLSLTKTTCRALSEQMVPEQATQADREYLTLAHSLMRSAPKEPRT